MLVWVEVHTTMIIIHCNNKGGTMGIAIALVVVVTAFAVVQTLLLGKNEDGSSLLCSQSKLVQTFVRCIHPESFVVVDLDGFLGCVGPSQLDGAPLRAAGVIAQHLCVGSNLTVSKGNVVMVHVVVFVLVVLVIAGGFATGER